MPANKSQRRLSSINGVAEEYDVSPRTVRRWIADGRIAGYRVGPRLIKIDMNEIDAIMRPVGGAA